MLIKFSMEIVTYITIVSLAYCTIVSFKTVPLSNVISMSVLPLGGNEQVVETVADD